MRHLASFFSTITGATKVDDLTVDIQTKGPDPLLPSRMYWMKMVPAKYSAETALADKPAGTGPYRLKEWARGNQIVLTANEDYWGEPAHLDKIIYRYLLIPITKKRLLEREAQFKWVYHKDFPLWGRGRDDAMNLTKYFLLNWPMDDTLGPTDMPSIWLYVLAAIVAIAGAPVRPAAATLMPKSPIQAIGR